MKAHSYGIIVFRDNPRKYLVLIKRSGTDFPKGHKEEGESDEQTALRETREEAGLGDVELIPGFREDTNFSFGKGKKRVDKTVTFFLGRTKGTVKISSEHQSFRWCTPEQAMKVLAFPDQRQLVQKAESFLRTGQIAGTRP
jgi:bis(5'-nucleosidyl)-tetraphosphatase